MAALEIADVSHVTNQEKTKWKEVSRESCPIKSHSCCSCHCCYIFVLVFLFFWIVFGIMVNSARFTYMSDDKYVTSPCDGYDECCSVIYVPRDTLFTYEDTDEEATDTFIKNMSCETYHAAFGIPQIIFYYLWLVVLILTIIGFIRLNPKLLLIYIIQSCVAVVIGIYGFIFCLAASSTSGGDLGYSIFHIFIGSISGYITYKIWLLIREIKNNNA